MADVSQTTDKNRGVATLYNPQQLEAVRGIVSTAEVDAMVSPERAQRIWDVASVRALNAIVDRARQPVDFEALAALILGAPIDFMPDGVSVSRVPLGHTIGFNRSVFFRGAVAVLLHGGFFGEAAEIEAGALAMYYLDHHDFEKAAFYSADAVDNFEKSGRLDKAAFIALKLGRALTAYGAIELGAKYTERGTSLLVKATSLFPVSERGPIVIAGTEILISSGRFDLAEKYLRLSGQLDASVFVNLAQKLMNAKPAELSGKNLYRRLSFVICLIEKLSVADTSLAVALTRFELSTMRGSSDVALIARHILYEQFVKTYQLKTSKTALWPQKIFNGLVVLSAKLTRLFSARALSNAGIDAHRVGMDELLRRADPAAARVKTLEELNQSIRVFEMFGRADAFAEKILQDFGPRLEALGEFQPALEHYVEAEKIFRQQKNHDQAAKALFKRICLLQKMNETVSIPVLFKQLFDMFDQANGEALPFGNLSVGFQLLIEAKQPTLAFTLFSRAVAVDGTLIKPKALIEVFESALSSDNLPKEKLHQFAYSYVANAFLVLDSAENKVEALWAAEKMASLLPEETPAQRAKKAAFLERLMSLCQNQMESDRGISDMYYKAEVASVWEHAGYRLDEVCAVDGKPSFGARGSKKTEVKAREMPSPLVIPEFLPPPNRSLRLEEMPTEQMSLVWVTGDEVELRGTGRASKSAVSIGVRVLEQPKGPAKEIKPK